MKNLTIITILIFLVSLSGIYNRADCRDLQMIFEAVPGLKLDEKYQFRNDSEVTWECSPYVGVPDAEGNIVLYDPHGKFITRVSKEGKYLGKTILGYGLNKDSQDLMHFVGIDQENMVLLYVPWYNTTMEVPGRDFRTTMVKYNFEEELKSVRSIIGIPFNDKYDYQANHQVNGNIIFTHPKIGTYLVQPNGQLISETSAKRTDYSGNTYAFELQYTDRSEQMSVAFSPQNEGDNQINQNHKVNPAFIDDYVQSAGELDESFFTLWLGANENNEVGFHIERARNKDEVGYSEFEYLIIDSQSQQLIEQGIHDWGRKPGMSPLLLFAYLDSDGDIIICTKEPTRSWHSRGSGSSGQEPGAYLRIYLLSR